MIRRLLIKYYALSYYTIDKHGKLRASSRARLPFLFSLLQLVLFVLLDSDYPEFSGDDIIVLGGVFFNIFMIFGYFRGGRGVKFEELDDQQKLDIYMIGGKYFDELDADHRIQCMYLWSDFTNRDKKLPRRFTYRALEFLMIGIMLGVILYDIYK